MDRQEKPKRITWDDIEASIPADRLEAFRAYRLGRGALGPLPPSKLELRYKSGVDEDSEPYKGES